MVSHTKDTCTMLRKVPFSLVVQGDLFIADECLFRKASEDHGELIRLGNGQEPTEETHVEFDADYEIELLETEK